MRIFASDVQALLAAGENRSALVRALLAYAVAEKWGCAMPEIRKDEKGKPYFVGREDMHFSLSHTKTHVLAAVSDCPVGADIEAIRPVKKEFERLFSPEMLHDFGYFGAWTLREAVFKLRGDGALRSMDIRLYGGVIVTPFEGLSCRSYRLPGLAAAAASFRDDFPEKIELVESSKFCCGNA